MLKGTMRKILLIRFLEDTLGAEVQQLKIFTSLFLHSPHTDRQEDYGREGRRNCRSDGKRHAAEQEPLDSGQQSYQDHRTHQRYSHLVGPGLFKSVDKRETFHEKESQCEVEGRDRHTVGEKESTPGDTPEPDPGTRRPLLLGPC